MTTGASTPLCVHFSSSGDSLIVAYAQDNLVVVYDLNNKCLHPWSIKYGPSAFAKEFRNRYNRIIGISEVSSSKFILYTNYTWCVLDLEAPIDQPDEHPTASSQAPAIFNRKRPGDSLNASATWFSCLKASQSKYVRAMLHGSPMESAT